MGLPLIESVKTTVQSSKPLEHKLYYTLIQQYLLIILITVSFFRSQAKLNVAVISPFCVFNTWVELI